MPAGQSEAGGTGRAAAARLAAMRTPSAQTLASAERFGLCFGLRACGLSPDSLRGHRRARDGGTGSPSPQPPPFDGPSLLTGIGPECNKFGMEPLVASLSTLGAVALVFIIARSLVLWYWKIDRGITLLERQNQLLEQQSSLLIKLVATQKVALLESGALNPSSP